MNFIEIKKAKLNNFSVKDKKIREKLKKIKNKNLDEENLQEFLKIMEDFDGRIFLTIDFTIQISKYNVKEYLINYYNNVKNN